MALDGGYDDENDVYVDVLGANTGTIQVVISDGADPDDKRYFNLLVREVVTL